MHGSKCRRNFETTSSRMHAHIRCMADRRYLAADLEGKPPSLTGAQQNAVQMHTFQSRRGTHEQPHRCARKENKAMQHARGVARSASLTRSCLANGSSSSTPVVAEAPLAAKPLPPPLASPETPSDASPSSRGRLRLGDVPPAWRQCIYRSGNPENMERMQTASL